MSSFRISVKPLAVLLLGSTIALSAEPAFAVEEQPREITVMADAVYSAPPDFVRVVVSVEVTAQTAREAENGVAAKVKEMRDALQKSGVTAELRDQGRYLEPAQSTGGNWRAGSAVVSRRFLAIETPAVDSASSVTDLALQHGGDRIVSVNYLVRDSSGASTKALKLATQRAREKADVLAKGLGLETGSLLGVTETVEPGGEVVRQRMEMGQSPVQFNDEELHVVVTARFEIKPK